MFKFLKREVGGVSIIHSAVRQAEAKLPAKDTKIYKCLLAVSSRWPKTIYTLEIARHGGLTGKETAALMVVLNSRGLVERLQERRGLSGGSIWILTNSAARLMNLKEYN